MEDILEDTLQLWNSPIRPSDDEEWDDSQQEKQKKSRSIDDMENTKAGKILQDALTWSFLITVYYLVLSPYEVDKSPIVTTWVVKFRSLGVNVKHLT